MSVIAKNSLILAALFCGIGALGCKTGENSGIQLSVSTNDIFPIQTCVHLRMPDEGRYYHALFQRPSRRRNNEDDLPEAFTGDWIKDETSMDIMKSDRTGLVSIPMVVVSGAHTFAGSATYKLRQLFPEYAANDRDVMAVLNAANASEFESDLISAIRRELEKQHAKVCMEDESSCAENTNGTHLGLDVTIVYAGMSGGGSISRSTNPKNAFKLDLRAQVNDFKGNATILQARYTSEALRFEEWSSDDAKAFAETRANSLDSVSKQITRQLVAFALKVSSADP